MKRMISTLLMTVALTTAAQAQSFTDQLISQYQGHGFTRVEVKNGPTQTKVEAIRGTQKVEVVYDRSTGEIIKQESERVRAGEDTRAGIEVDTRSRDFVGDDRRTASSDDDDGDDRGRGRGRGSDDDDDSNDDDRGRGRGGDDDSSDDSDHDDDHGGDRDRGGDDDHGGDRGGDDDHDGGDDHGSDDD